MCVDSFNGNKLDESDFGAIFRNCKYFSRLFSLTLMLSVRGDKSMRLLVTLFEQPRL